MNSIFADKRLLKQEYKRLFLDNLSNLKKCLCSRYDKKNVDDAILKKLFSNNHKVIFDFIGTNNESRIKHFFGDMQYNDARDSQIRLIDRLILDSIHFEVMITLITRLDKEYLANQAEIDRAWNKEFQEHAHLGPIESIYILHSVLKTSKKMFFDDLKFPKQHSITLFSFNQSEVIINKQIFGDWIPRAVPVQNTLHYLIPGFLVVLLLTSFLYGALIGSFGGPIGIVIGILITVLLGVIGTAEFAADAPNEINYKTTLNSEADEYISCSSYALMNNNMPSVKEFDLPLQPEPFIKKNIMFHTQHHPDEPSYSKSFTSSFVSSFSNT